MSVQKAVDYVLAHGSSVEQARLASLLWGRSPAGEVIRELESHQMPDGGFHYWLPDLSTLCDTTQVLEWCDDLGLQRHRLVQRACHFLHERQAADGGWDEVEGVRGLDLPEWMLPGRLENRLWLTGCCAHVLLRHDRAGAHLSRRAAGFLLGHADESGRLPGYLRSTWIALPLLAVEPGRDSEAFARALAVTEAGLSPTWPGSLVAWLLRCLLDAGVPAAHPLVRRAMGALASAQSEDGSWESEEGEEFSAAATVEALRALVGYSAGQ